MRTIGTDYATATAPSDDNLLGLDLSQWGGDRRAADRRKGAPWERRKRAMADGREYIRKKVTTYCPWMMWQ